MKQQDVTKPQALIIDTANKPRIWWLYALCDKQSQALEYAKDIIKENPNGINLKNLTAEIKRMAKFDEVEICGMNALKTLLKQFNGRFYKIKTSSNRYNFSTFYPLISNN